MQPLADLLAHIQDAQEQMLGTMPFRDFGSPARLGASETALATAEQRIGRALPPSYRAFLRLHDGWSRFYDGAALLGTATLGLRQYDDLARATFDAAETPVPDVGPPSRFKPRVLIPFGIDVQAMTLFVFNPAVCDASGEYEVIAWINELGIRRSSFPSFLEMIGELCDAELASDAQSGLTL
ncbi:MAG: SMI1/KNR4 family protein [Polyangiaceae bacterium]|nr:SMI1/KNR4 family protein [Polyangiaceae bacterium]